jgi:hypothetical protein
MGGYTISSLMLNSGSSRRSSKTDQSARRTLARFGEAESSSPPSAGADIPARSMAARGVTQHQEAARPIMRPDRKARLSLKFCAIVE